MRLTMLTMLLLIPSTLPAQDWLDKVLAAAQLPVASAEAREEGVPNISISEFLDRVRQNRVPAEDAWRIMDEEVRVVKAGGPRENFGAFVQTQLDAGLRGRALADAIHEEHRRRGMGRPDDRGREGNRGQSDDRREPNDGRARPDEARPDGRRPDDASERRRGERPNQTRDTTRKDRRP
jgi:hypothetical protein